MFDHSSRHLHLFPLCVHPCVLMQSKVIMDGTCEQHRAGDRLSSASRCYGDRPGAIAHRRSGMILPWCWNSPMLWDSKVRDYLGDGVGCWLGAPSYDLTFALEFASALRCQGVQLCSCLGLGCWLGAPRYDLTLALQYVAGSRRQGMILP